MDKLNPWTVGWATAVTFMLVNAVCAVAVALFPDWTIGFANAWAHGLDLTLLKSTKPFTAASFLYGLLGGGATFFAVGVLFAAVYNYLLRWGHRDEPGHGRLAH